MQDTEHDPGDVKELSQVVRSWGEYKAKHDVGGSDTVTERAMTDIKRILEIREDFEPLFSHAASSLLDGGECWEAVGAFLYIYKIRWRLRRLWCDRLSPAGLSPYF